ncbi:hypothetical protein TNIN_342051 [Trichonephila inaurata madagascariensis]|uniref:Uncharacterized protein n=1 Tax=Trichonephila inaurata madagascariensis TaxID=2747483 RepID=A0A8X6JXS9_9ARAC|nr:hypothetical protein TNIN_342051 [Trichonephila inaurata madagascariensis]
MGLVFSERALSFLCRHLLRSSNISGCEAFLIGLKSSNGPHQLPSYPQSQNNFSYMKSYSSAIWLQFRHQNPKPHNLSHLKIIPTLPYPNLPVSALLQYIPNQR